MYEISEGGQLFVDQVDTEKNFVFLPGITVSAEYRYISGISAMMPSPDWFTGFYLLDTVDDIAGTYWKRIIIRTFPWDAGTDSGTSYTSLDADLDPPLMVERITSQNAPSNGIFLSPDGSEVRPAAEWDCVLHVCPGSGQDCHRENWPPSNGCDLLKYPGCEQECDNNVESCQECKPKDSDGDRQVVFYKNCCQSNYEPLNGWCGAPVPTYAPTTTASLPTFAPPTTPSGPCYDVTSFGTSFPSPPAPIAYSGIMFDLFTNNNPLEILSLEINVQKLDEITDFSVEVFITDGLYLEKFSDPNQWERVAKATALPVPGRSNAIIIPQREFSKINLGPRERLSVYIQMKGPWIDNTFKALVKTGEIAFMNDDFFAYAGVGVSEPFPDKYETLTDPQFSGKVYYQKQKACTNVTQTVVDLQFVGGPSFDVSTLPLLSASVQKVVRTNVMFQDWFKDKSSGAAALKLFSNVKSTLSPWDSHGDGGNCPWPSCTLVKSQVTFSHSSVISPGELRYELYRYAGSITREVKEQLKFDELMYIGFKSATSGFKLRLDGVPEGESMSNEQEVYFGRTLVNFFQETIPSWTSSVTVFDWRIFSGTNERSLRVRRKLDGSMEVSGTLFAGRGARLHEQELVAELDLALRSQQDLLVNTLSYGSIIPRSDPPSEAALTYFKNLVGVHGNFALGPSVDADWSDEPSTPTRPLVSLAGLVRVCSLRGSVEDLVKCMSEKVGALCFDDDSSGDIAACLMDGWSGAVDPNGSDLQGTIGNAAAACFDPVTECIANTIQDGFAGLPSCTVESGLALAECFVDNAGICATSCTKGELDFSGLLTVGLSDLMSCSSIMTNVFNPLCESVSCCPPCTDELDDLSECILDTFISCEFDCHGRIPHSGNVTTGIDGGVRMTPAAVVISKCVSIASTSPSRNITVLFDFFDCIVDEILESYRDLISAADTNGVNSTEQESPTLTPANDSNETIDAKTPTQSHSFEGLVIRLAGAKRLTAKSRAAFELAAKEFYLLIFAIDKDRRRLQDFSLADFDTVVTVAGEEPDSTGNTITYNQTVTFVSSGGYIDESTALLLLQAPLSEEESKQELVTLLKEKDEVFKSVTKVESQQDLASQRDNDAPTESPVQNEDSSESGRGNSVLIGCIVGVLCLCFCGGAFVYVRRLKTNPEEDEGKFFDPNDDYDDELPPESAPQDSPPIVRYTKEPGDDFHDETE